jgi:hypothetical protein
MSETHAVPAGLRWCVGKFVYPRGASEPLHFMELKRFIIDDALDFSHLFYLRGRRLLFNEQPETDAEFARWMAATAVGPVAEALAHVHQHRDLPLVEFYPGVGLVLESLKALRGPAAARLRYTGCGPAAGRDKLCILHDRDVCPVAYADDTDAAVLASAAPALRFYNHEQSIRLDVEPAIGLERFVAAAGSTALIAARVTTASVPRWHTTVKGRALELPSLERLLGSLRAQGAWCYRFIAGHDAGFLIPDGGEPTGLLIAHTRVAPDLPKGYQAA